MRATRWPILAALAHGKPESAGVVSAPHQLVRGCDSCGRTHRKRVSRSITLAHFHFHISTSFSQLPLRPSWTFLWYTRQHASSTRTPTVLTTFWSIWRWERTTIISGRCPLQKTRTKSKPVSLFALATSPINKHVPREFFSIRWSLEEDQSSLIHFSFSTHGRCPFF